ncbi:MAG: hypothetical protein LBR69_07500 [Endomicrobium sp.]|jgi:flagellar biosynthesis/type III secretory pathway M-ring protein FliF/YscJ|nr:hypothetical protein [Endomicrobium sp.]
MEEKIKEASGTAENGEKILAWQPNYKWLAKTAAIIFAALIAVFFTLNIVLKPYMREIPAEITPWLDKTTAEQSK